MGSAEYEQIMANVKSLEKTREKISPYKKGQLKADVHKLALEEIRRLKDLEIKQSGDFIRLKNRLERYGNLDYKYMKATIYKENFIKALTESGAENMENYEILKKKLDRFKNPISFFNFIQNSDIFKDIFIYYKPRRRCKIWKFFRRRRKI